MARPRSVSAKHRREYVIRCYDPNFYTEIYFIRCGYKSLLLSEFSRKFPYHDISIYVLSAKIIQNDK